MNYYGGLSEQAIAFTVLDVCSEFGNSENATALILETIATETQFGNARDTSISNGMGICQFDDVGFYDVIKRTSLKGKVLSVFNIDLDLITLSDLRYNEFLSVLMCRLKYALLKDPIPSNREDRAAYWKTHYNTKAGKGTIEHYLESCEAHLS